MFKAETEQNVGIVTEKQPVLILEEGRAEGYLDKLKKLTESRTRRADYEAGNFTWAKKGKSGRWSLGAEGRKMAAEEILGVFETKEVVQATNLDTVRHAVEDRLEEIGENIKNCRGKGSRERKAYWKLAANSLKRRTKKMEKLIMVDIAATKGTELGKVVNTIENCKGLQVADKMAKGLWEFHLRRKKVTNEIQDTAQKGYFMKSIDEVVASSVSDWWNKHNKTVKNYDDLIPDALAEKYLGNNPRITKDSNRLEWLNVLWFDLVSEAERKMVKKGNFEKVENKEVITELPRHLSWRERAKVAAVAFVAESAVALVYLATSFR